MNAYHNGTNGLHPERDTRGKLGVLTLIRTPDVSTTSFTTYQGKADHLQVTDDTTGLTESVVPVKREVHVGLGAAGNHRSAQHLDQALDVRGETGDGVDGHDEGQEDGGDDEADDEAPPWEVRVTGVDGGHGHAERGEEHSH